MQQKNKTLENQRRRESKILGLSETESRQFSGHQKSIGFFSDWEIIKNVIDLEYRKLLHEYNAILIAITSVTIGVLAFVYNTTKNMTFS